MKFLKYFSQHNNTHYTQDQQPPAPEKSVKTQGENPRKQRATTKCVTQTHLCDSDVIQQEDVTLIFVKI